MNYKSFLAECGKRMLHSSLTIETWGNISVRDPETGLIYLTPSGMPYDLITEEDIVIMNREFQIVEGNRKPTIESNLHIRILNSRADIQAIVHTHPVYSQIFACLHEDIPPVIDEAAQILGGVVRCASYGLPGSDELAENVVRALGDGAACLMANHGAVCVGEDMDGAFRVGTVLEMTAQIYHMARTIGSPQLISDDKVAFMKDFAKNHYGQGK